jgi:hypothetical protein
MKSSNECIKSSVNPLPQVKRYNSMQYQRKIRTNGKRSHGRSQAIGKVVGQHGRPHNLDISTGVEAEPRRLGHVGRAILKSHQITQSTAYTIPSPCCDGGRSSWSQMDTCPHQSGNACSLSGPCCPWKMVMTECNSNKNASNWYCWIRASFSGPPVTKTLQVHPSVEENATNARHLDKRAWDNIV